MANFIALPEGTELVGDFRIQRVLGAGGFGVTYLADELALGRAVTIKEYFPSDFAARGGGFDAVPRSENCAGDYKWGLDRFIEEAQTLARFDHPNIVRVYRYFRANNTGYMVLQFEEGQSLKTWLKNLGRAPRQKELDAILAPLLDALEVIHKADFLHRDIAPDNIIIRKNGEPVLIDFGSARGEIAAHSKTVSALVKPGYSPYEQYAETSRQQGPWTDIYALAATLYHAVTGKRPPDAPSRMVKDEMIAPREAAISSYRAGFLRAIERALALSVDQRPQSVVAWRGELLAPDPPKPGWLARGKDKKNEAVLVTPTPGAVVPPPPDAPGPQGGLLDFVDNLKQGGQPAAAAVAAATAVKADAPPPGTAKPAAAAATAKLEEPPAAPRKRKEKAASQPKLPAVQPAPAEPQPEQRKKPVARPKPIKSRERGGWRPLLFKLAIGAGIASAAVAMQDRTPTPATKETIRNASVPASHAKVEPPQQPVIAAQLKGHRGPVAAVAYSEDGKLVATAGADATLKIWAPDTGILQRSIDLDAGPATSLSLSEHRALTGHGDGQVVIWDLDRGQKIASYRRNEANVWSVAFAGSTDRFVAASHDWKVALWDAKAGGQPAHVFDGHDSTAQAVAYSPRRDLVASGGADKSVKLWSLDKLSLVRSYKGQKDFVTALTFSPDGRTLASATLDGGIRLLSSISSRHIRTLVGHKGRIGALAYAPDGDLLASASDDGTVRLWDVKRGRTERALTTATGPARSVAFSPDGQRLAIAGEDSTVRVYSVASLVGDRD
jgi:serine/threonine protein kinase